MKRKTFNVSLASIAVLLMLIPAQTAGQQWSQEQQQVWKSVSEMMSRFFAGDVEGGYQFVHPEIVWWNTDNDAPGDYAAAKKLDTAYAGGRKWLGFSCTPLTIQVFDTFAVVNTYCRGFRENPRGQDPEYSTMRWHFVMKKDGGKWLQVANYGDFRPR